MIPYWGSLSAFSTASTQDSYKNWKKKAKYFNTDKLYKDMVDIIKDENASFLTRASAISVIKAHCSADKFKELKKDVDPLKDPKASSIKSSYESKAK